MPGGGIVAVMLELRVGAKPIAGSLRLDGGPQKSFRGWLQLTSLLEAAVDHEDHQAAAEPEATTFLANPAE